MLNLLSRSKVTLDSWEVNTIILPISQRRILGAQRILGLAQGAPGVGGRAGYQFRSATPGPRRSSVCTRPQELREPPQILREAEKI